MSLSLIRWRTMKRMLRKQVSNTLTCTYLANGFPQSVLPKSLDEWLQGYGMEQHKDAFLANGFENLLVLKELTLEDLEAIGIPLLGHRKTLLLAASELKEAFASRLRKDQALKNSGGVRVARGAAPKGVTSSVTRSSPPHQTQQPKAPSRRGGESTFPHQR